MQFNATREIRVYRTLSYSFQAESWEEAQELMDQYYVDYDDYNDWDEDDDGDYELECAYCGCESNCDCEEEEEVDRQREESSEFFAELGL